METEIDGEKDGERRRDGEIEGESERDRTRCVYTKVFRNVSGEAATE